LLSANQIVMVQDRETLAWHQTTVDAAPTMEQVEPGYEGDWLAAVARQHVANCELWHIEDEARRPGATDAELADVKRRIDRTNQRRNDLAEALDRFLLEWLQTKNLLVAHAPLHSESPGLIIDRLSILSLKIYHTREETERGDASPGHRERNLERLAILAEQRADLAGCLHVLWQQTIDGTRRFKLYRQLKMYNDPLLNPAIYGERLGKASP